LDGKFTYLPPPVITSHTPERWTGRRRQPVTITGTGLLAATSVTFGGHSGNITANTANQHHCHHARRRGPVPPMSSDVE